jgi:radical SAM superfamily enzyme YgiQ (UPF0313 family)
MEWAIDQKYPRWRELPLRSDGSAGVAPAGVRTVEEVLVRNFGRENVVACYPDQLELFVGPQTRVVAVSTHNPLGTTFAAGVYASIFGSTRDPLNAVYAKALFARIKSSPFRESFRVIVGGSGGWQIVETNSYEALGVDTVVDGRSESAETLEVFRRALAGGELPREVKASHPLDPEVIAIPARRTTFGVIEMTTGCGRRCAFCLPDLNPQISIPWPRSPPTWQRATTKSHWPPRTCSFGKPDGPSSFPTARPCSTSSGRSPLTPAFATSC